MNVRCMYYGKRYSNKPDSIETKKIQKLIKPITIDIGDLADGLSHGATFKPALLNGTKSADWVSQRLFALDFDHGTTIQAELARCRKLNILPCFGYTSFSHSEAEHHFRLIFCTDKIVTDRNVRNKLQDTLIDIFHSDKVTFDCTRMFYGGKSLICDTYDNRINAEQVIKQYWKPEISNHEKSNTKTVSSCKKKLKIYSNTELNENVEAIKKLDVEKMRILLESTPDKEGTISSSIRGNFQLKKFQNEKDLYRYINSIDLSEYLGIDGYVNCILPEHEDFEPSAHIYVTDDKTQVYKCFGCGHVYTIIGITEKLAHCKKSKAIEFIKAIYNLKLEKSKWVKQQQQMLIDNANYLDSEDFELQFPTLSKLIRTRKVHIQKILLHFTQYVQDDLLIDNRPFFYDSYSNLMNVCGIQNGSHKILSQSLTLFALLNMIEKLSPEVIPDKELNKAKHIAATYGFKKLTGFYSFEEYGVNLFENSEEIAKTLRKNNISLKGLSRDYILRTFGIELANKVYPQFKFENKLGTSKRSNEATSKLMNKLCNIINKQGYCLESDIKGKGQTEIQWKRSIQQILNIGNFKRVKASKANKLQYHIPGSISYQSYVIVNG